jgi:hypothetical protein
MSDTTKPKEDPKDPQKKVLADLNKAANELVDLNPLPDRMPHIKRLDFIVSNLTRK